MGGLQSQQAPLPTNYRLPPFLRTSQQWVVNYVQRAHNGHSVANVIAIGVDGFKDGGGGLYCKANESDQTFER